MHRPPIIQMRNVWKEFPEVIANKGVSLDLQAGEVNALLGENGAGKTTLMNVLSGLYRATSGEIFVDGERVEITSPAMALGLGIGMVHQHFRLVPNLTVAENLHLGWRATPWHPSRKRLRQRVKEICDRFGYDVNPDARVWQLSVGEQQRVEILRVLARGARVIILDEPTSVLTPNEADDLFRVLRNLASEGRAVVFISHKLDEVMRVSDRVTVLRNGERVATELSVDCDHRLLARLMIGKNVEAKEYGRMGDAGEKLLELQDVSAPSDRGLPAIKSVSLAVHRREIVGIAGVAGNGQSELAEVVTGLRDTSGGSILVKGADFTGRRPTQFLRAGIGHIPEDRTGVGLVMNRSMIHNAILRTYTEPPIRKGPRIDGGEAASSTERLAQRARIRVRDLRAAIGTLSGGNQQRFLARREADAARSLLIAVHPTRGLDIVATDELREAIIAHRNDGNGVLLISEDLDELLVVADRILVMYEGRVVHASSTKSADREEVALAMGGVVETEQPP